MPDPADFSAADSLEAQRMAFAWQCVEEAQNGNCLSDYENLSRKTAGYIRANGLGATLALLYCKNKSEHRLLLTHIGAYLRLRNFVADHSNAYAIVRAFVGFDWFKRQHSETELIQMFEWLRRFASGRMQQ